MRAWLWLAAIAAALVLFVHSCVRFVPADEPVSQHRPDADAESLLVPVANIRRDQLVDTFNQSREQGRPHLALDILAPRGTPVLAAAAGTIEKLFLSKRGGKTIYVRSRDGKRIYYYAHLESYRADLSENQAVARGEVLGTVGSTGNADPAAPHLHFAVHKMLTREKWYQGTPINPYPLLVGKRS